MDTVQTASGQSSGTNSSGTIVTVAVVVILLLACGVAMGKVWRKRRQTRVSRQRYVPTVPPTMGAPMHSNPMFSRAMASVRDEEPVSLGPSCKPNSHCYKSPEFPQSKELDTPRPNARLTNIHIGQVTASVQYEKRNRTSAEYSEPADSIAPPMQTEYAVARHFTTSATVEYAPTFDGSARAVASKKFESAIELKQLRNVNNSSLDGHTINSVAKNIEWEPSSNIEYSSLHGDHATYTVIDKSPTSASTMTLSGLLGTSC